MRLLLLITGVLSSLFLMGQTGVIKGRVVDEATGQPLPFTNIVISGTVLGAVSDIEGVFMFTKVAPGFVKMEASSVGYENYVSAEFMVTNTRTVNFDISLRKKAVELESYEVKASVFRRPAESPVSMRTLGIRDIEKSPGANRDISRVIQTLPGVSSAVAYRNDIIVRGGGPSENRFYLDGIEIPTLNHFATQGASGGPVGIINVDFVREADFYSAAFPVNYGNTLSSVLSFKQIDGNTERWNFRSTLGATDLALTADGPVSSKSSLVFSVRRSYLQFLFDVIGLPFLPVYNDAQFKYKARISDDWQFTLLGIGAWDDMELNTGISNPDDFQKYILGYLPENRQRSYTLGAVLRKFRKNGASSWFMSRNFLDNRAYKYRNNESALGKLFDYRSTEAENKVRYEQAFSVNKTNFMWGVGGGWARYTNSTDRKVFIEDLGLISEKYNAQLDLKRYALFFRADRTFFDEKVTLSAGGRLDANDYSVYMNNPVDQFSPRISSSWQWSEKWSLNANVGRYYQLPSYPSLGFKNNQGVLINREQGLRYIRADQVVAGVEYRPHANGKFTTELFYKNYAHYPWSVRDSVTIASKGGDYGTFGDESLTSQGEGRAFGMEFLWRERDVKGYSLILTYTFVRSEFTAFDGKLIPSAWDNRHLINVTASKQLKKGWFIGLRWRYMGGAPYTPYDLVRSSYVLSWDVRGTAYPDYARFNQERLKSYHQLDLRVDKQFFFKRWALILYLDIQNVYAYNAPQPDIVVNYASDGTVELINPEAPVDLQRYRLHTISDNGGNTIPTVGIMIDF